MNGLGRSSSMAVLDSSADIISCTWYHTSDITAWVNSIIDLGIINFKAIIDDLSVSKVVFAESVDDPHKCVMFIWHSDGGEKYFNFEEANVLEGGVLRSAADAGAIELPFRHMFFLNENRDGWATKMRPTDILSLSYFPTKSHIGFSDAFQEDADTNNRRHGALQTFVGQINPKMIPCGAAILSHYSGRGWNDVGDSVAKAFVQNPPVSYLVSGPVTSLNCKVLATFDNFTWLGRPSEKA